MQSPRMQPPPTRSPLAWSSSRLWGQVYGGKFTLVGVGVFQTIATRNAGLQLVDLRRFNQVRLGEPIRAGCGPVITDVAISHH